jgi:hypothetical protein
MYFGNLSKTIVQLAAAAATLLMPALVLAGTATNQITTNINIYMGSSGTTGVLVAISPRCTDTAGDYVFINFSSTVLPTGRDLYATVLAAMLASQPVAFGTSGCDPTGYYPQVYGVNLY